MQPKDLLRIAMAVSCNPYKQSAAASAVKVKNVTSGLWARLAELVKLFASLMALGLPDLNLAQAPSACISACAICKHMRTFKLHAHIACKQDVVSCHNHATWYQTAQDRPGAPKDKTKIMTHRSKRSLQQYVNIYIFVIQQLLPR